MRDREKEIEKERVVLLDATFLFLISSQPFFAVSSGDRWRKDIIVIPIAMEM